MFANDLVLDKADGTDMTYRLVQNGPDGTKRIDIASTTAEPRVLNIRHSTSGKGSAAVDRHNIQFVWNVNATPAPVALTSSYSLVVPRSTVITTTMIADMVTHLTDLLSSGAITGLASTVNVEALVRGES